MPTLSGKLLEESCPDCLHKGKSSKLVEVVQDWDMEEEGNKAIILKQCPCGYKVEVCNGLHGLNEPSEAEIKSLNGEKNWGYRIDASFSWIVGYFNSFA